MKPYLVHKTWIDLDTIQMINAESFCSGYPPYSEHYPVVSVWRMFCEDPMLVHLADPCSENVSADVVIAQAKPVLDAFISAWKAKDEPLVRVVPFVEASQKVVTDAMENYHEPRP